MKVSSTTTIITPEGIAYLDGYLNDMRQLPATGVHDDAFAMLLLLDFDGMRVLFVGLDVCSLSLTRTTALRQALSRELSVTDDNIVLSATHSHSCANGLRDGSLITHDTPGYQEFVAGKVIQAASKLPGMLVEAAPELAHVRVRGWYSNRNDTSKPFDDNAYVIRWRAADGTVAGALMNFNCHSTVVGPWNSQVTADLQGNVRALLAPWVGCAPYAFTGASGDLGNRQFRKGDDFAELRRVSVGIASVIMDSTFLPVELESPTTREFLYQVDYDNTAFFASYEQKIAEARATLANPDATPTAKKFARTEVSKLTDKLGQERIAFPVTMRLIDFGSIAFVTFPGELCSSLGLRIKSALAPKTCLIIGYANDYQSYFVPCEDFGLDYESYATKMYQGGIEEILDSFEEWL